MLCKQKLQDEPYLQQNPIFSTRDINVVMCGDMMSKREPIFLLYDASEKEKRSSGDVLKQLFVQAVVLETAVRVIKTTVGALRAR